MAPRFAMALAVAVGLALPAHGDVTIFAAASLKTALDGIAADFRKDTGISAVVAYGGTPTIARQIIDGAPAEVVIAASTDWMDKLAEAGSIRGESRVDLLGNEIVLVGPKGSQPAEMTPGYDLKGLLAGGKLAMAMVDSVPAGQYGKAALQSLGLWEGVAAEVAQTENVRAALALVAAGEAAAGIVYATDARAEPGVAVIATFPADSHPAIVYPAAIVQPGTDDAAAFMTYLHGDAARAVFEAQGFVVLPK